MRVTVLGAGVIGMSCAYYLARAGHEVVVVDRQRGPALETSFANAGGICPGFAGLGRRRTAVQSGTLAVHERRAGRAAAAARSVPVALAGALPA